MKIAHAVKKYIIDHSYNTTYGARPIKRFIQKNIETEIAKKIISSQIEPNFYYEIDYQGQLVIVSK